METRGFLEKNFKLINFKLVNCQWIGLINTLVGDRFNRNYEIHILNSLTLCYTQLSFSATLKSRVYPTGHRLGIFPITFVFSSSCSRSTVLAYISLIRSFFCPGISQTLRSHHTTLILSLSPHSSFHTNIMYFHSSMATTSSYTSSYQFQYGTTSLNFLKMANVRYVPLFCSNLGSKICQSFNQVSLQLYL